MKRINQICESFAFLCHAARRAAALIALVFTIGRATGVEAQTDFNQEVFLTAADPLLALPHRLAGSYAGQYAYDVIIKALRRAGVADSMIMVQRFDVTQLDDQDSTCYLERDGQHFAMTPMRPNGLALAVTPPQGLEGQTIYLGNGSGDAFLTNNVRDRIVVLDYASAGHWFEAARLGALAVVFVRQEAAPDALAPPSALRANFAFPRFMVAADVARAAGLLDKATVRLVSHQSLRQSEGRNIFVLIPGAAPDAGQAEVVAFATAYDTFGPAPFASRSPDTALNAAALTAVAGALCAAPPSRDVLIAFFDNQAQDRAGEFYFHFARQDGGAGPLFKRMLDDRRQEAAVLEARLATINATAPLPPHGTDGARREILDQAEALYNQAARRLSDLRREHNLRQRQIDTLRAQLRHAGEPALASRLQGELDAAQRVFEAQEGRDAPLLANEEARKEDLYGVRRLLMAGTPPMADTPAAVKTAYGALFDGLRDTWQRRLREINREVMLITGHRELAGCLGERRLLAMMMWHLPTDGAPWAILGNGATAGSIANVQVSRWIETETAAGKVDGCAGFVNTVELPAAAGIGGRATYVLELGDIDRKESAAEEAPAALARFGASATHALAFCRAFAAHPDLSRTRVPARLDSVLTFNVPLWTASGRYDGCFVREYDEKTKAGRALPGTPVWIQQRSSVGQAPQPNAWGGMWVSSAVTGAFPLFGLRNEGVVLQAVIYDRDGAITALSQLHPDGTLGKAGNWETPAWFFVEANNQVIVSDVRSSVRIAGIGTPAGGAVLPSAISFWDAFTAGKPKQLNLTMNEGLLAAFTGRMRRYLLLNESQLLLHATDDTPAGVGCEPQPQVVDALAQAADDVWRLNESRLDKLRRHNIQENALERLHARAQELRDAAVSALPANAGALRQASLAYSARVYGPVRKVTNDLVKAVIILLLLAIPFSFALERVISGSANVYWQIIGFALCFSAVFTILYLVHPAFRFTSFPLIVLLAFVIIILSGLVITLMWSKFEYELRKLHGVATASHQSTRTAQGTITAAVTLGIATMRRRPLRTALTALTILLLTFTILFFGSFKSEDGIRTVLVGPGPRQPQVEVGAVPGKPFAANTAAMMRLLFHQDGSTNYFRYWAAAEEQRTLAGRLPDQSVFTVAGFATVPPPDLRLYPELRDALHGDIEGFATQGGVLLPPRLYQQALAAASDAPAPYVVFEGQRHRLRGTFAPAKLKAVRTLDGAAFIPPDLAEVRRQLEAQYPRDPDAVRLKLEEMDLADLPLIDPEESLLVWDPQSRFEALPAQSLVFLPPDEAAARSVAAEATIILDRRVTLAAAGDHFRVLYTSRLSLGGIARVLVPLILGGLIIFGTMLSSVSDRQREIFTFSALGLGPRHVAALFFAEACVYAVIGGMGGYLFTHAFAKLIEFLARMGLTEAPAINHSSMNAMLTLLVVMATVLISTIYPAIRASRAANPGAQRQWRMPAAEGDTLALDFPFTVSTYDVIGLVSFLEEYLMAHRDKSIGSFAADRVTVERQGERFVIEAMIWLQPYDQGVSQTFIMRTTPSDIEGIDRIHVTMVRLSGSPTIWQRSCKVFIHALREQFILWRTIPEEATEHYHALTTKRFAPEQGALPT